MTTRTVADSFRELGMKPPDLSVLEPAPVPPGRRFGREPVYNTRALVDNWYEDRRQYKLLCPRCTGPTIYKTDYPAHCLDESKIFPHPKYKYKLAQEGEGVGFLRDPFDYCQYLQNYTTTYDLMHNWEVRRAGVKPKPWRRWKMVHGSIWAPQNDNAVSFGNLTQIGYRRAPQLPMLPNDWDLYANTGYITETKEKYPKWRYPDDYVMCRKLPKPEVVKEMRALTLIKKQEDPCGPCDEASLYYSEKFPMPKCCPRCQCYDNCCCLKSRNAYCSSNPSRFGNLIPHGVINEHRAKQTLHPPKLSFPYKTLKRKPHPRSDQREKCKIKDEKPMHCITKLFEDPLECRDYAGETRFDYKGILKAGPSPFQQ